MATDRRRQMLLGALLLVLAGVIVYQFSRQPAAVTPPPSNGVRAGATARGRSATPIGPVPDVRLEALQQPRPQPATVARNLFQFGPARPLGTGGPGGPGTSGPPGAGLRGGLPAGGRTGPPPTPPVAVIPLKFIGILSAPGRIGRVAVLTDGRGVYHGREGDVILGRYRIVHIGIESIVLKSLDNGVQQTIRLTGGGT